MSAAPYVGPRALRADEPFYGRTTEAAALLNTLLAKRIVLLYSPSGAGKSSLIHASLLPKLERDYGFVVLPTVRVNLRTEDAHANRYVFSTIASLEATDDRSEGALGLSEEEIARTELDDYLFRRQRDDGSPLVIVFDQFEELISADSFDRPAKREFILQLARALQGRRLYALFAMREEFLGAFDEYRQFLPTRLAAQMRLSLLGHKAALDAIMIPAERATPSRPFTEPAARMLLDKLVYSGTDDREYPFVQPFQLQVICLRIWQQTEGAKQIKRGDVRREGDVGQALARYYGKEVCRAALLAVDDEVLAESKQPLLPDALNKSPEERWCDRDASDLPPQLRSVQRSIRTWFETGLISPERDRRLTQSTPKIADEERRDAVLAHLSEVHLVTTEPRATRLWYELSHDRLVEAVRSDNAAWIGRNLNRFQKRAAAWIEAGQPDDALPSPGEFADLRVLATDIELTKDESEFLKRAEAHTKKQRRRNVAISLTITVLVALLVIAGWQWRSANTAAEAARSAELVGEARAVDDPNLAIILAAEAADSGGIGQRSALYLASASRVRRALWIEGTPDRTPLEATAVATASDGRIVVRRPSGVVVDIADPGADQVTSSEIQSPSDVHAIAVDASTTALLAPRQLIIIRDGEESSVPIAPSGVDVAAVNGVVAVLLEDGTLSIHTPTGDATSFAAEARITSIASDRAKGFVIGLDDGSTGSLAADAPDPGAVTYRAPDIAATDTAIVAIAADGQTIAAVHDNGQLELIPRDAGEASIVAPLGEPLSEVEMTSTGVVAVLSRDGTVRAISPQTGSELFTVALPAGAANGMAALPDEELVIAQPGVATSVWDFSTGHLPGQTLAIAVTSPDTIISGGSDGQVLAWRRRGTALVEPRPLREPDAEPQAVVDLAIRADGLLAAAVGSRAELTAPRDGTRVVLEHDANVRVLGFVPDSDDVVTVTDGGTLTRWTESGSPRSKAALAEAAPADLAVTNSRAIVLTADGRLVGWRFADDTVQKLALPEGFGSATSIGRSDKDVLIGTSDGLVLVIDESKLGDPDPAAYAQAGPGLSAVTAIAASPGSETLLAFTMADGTTEVWAEANNGRWEIRERVPGRSRVVALGFATGNSALVTATSESRLIVYSLERSALREIALDRLGRDPTPRECDRFDLEQSWCD